MKKVRYTRRQTPVLGEFGELCFATKAASLGFAISKPHGSLRYDVVVDTGAQLLRIQVKTVGQMYRGAYHVNSRRGDTRAYRASEIDFLVAYVIPEEAWYVIPVAAVTGRSGICLYPHRKGSARRYEKYREAWHLLAPKPLIRRIFAQADTGEGPLADLETLEPTANTPTVAAPREAQAKPDENMTFDICAVVEPRGDSRWKYLSG